MGSNYKAYKRGTSKQEAVGNIIHVPVNKGCPH